MEARGGYLSAGEELVPPNRASMRASQRASIRASRAANRASQIGLRRSVKKSIVEAEPEPDDFVWCEMDRIMGVVIVLNSLQIGAEHQWFPEQSPALAAFYNLLDFVFAGLYLTELCINLKQQGREFFEHAWNYVDLVLTGLALYDIVKVYSSSGSSHSGILRLIRFVRIFRLLKVFRQVPDLIMVIEGLMKSMKSLSWVLLLLSLIVYVFAVILTMTIGDANSYGDEFEHDYFTDMLHSMMTLMDIAILAEWGEIIRPVLKHQPLLLPLFFIFALVSSFGMLNVMIGVIVDSTAEARKELEDQQRQAQIEAASQIWQDKIHAKGLSAKDIAQSSNPNEKSKERRAAILDIMQDVIDDPNTIDVPHGLGPEDVISLLDFDGSGEVTHQEFVDGLERLLLGDQFQLTCLMLTVMGKLRKERSNGHAEITRKLDDITRRLDRMEEFRGPALEI